MTRLDHEIATLTAATPELIGELHRRGLRRPLPRDGYGLAPLGFARTRNAPNDLFKWVYRPGRSHVPAAGDPDTRLILPMADWQGETIDALAVDLAGHFAPRRRFGDCAALGLPWLHRQRGNALGAAIKIVADPLDWLRLWGRALWICDWSDEALRLDLRGMTALHFKAGDEATPKAVWDWLHRTDKRAYPAFAQVSDWDVDAEVRADAALSLAPEGSFAARSAPPDFAMGPEADAAIDAEIDKRDAAGEAKHQQPGDGPHEEAAA